jgi:hypothetical protein
MVSQRELDQLAALIADPRPTDYLLGEWIGEQGAQLRADRLSAGKSIMVTIASASRRYKDVEATPIGEWLAVHRTDEGKGWTITHLASGIAVRQEIETHRLAAAIATALDDLPAASRVNWSREDPFYRVSLKWKHSISGIKNAISVASVEAEAKDARSLAKTEAGR